MTVLHPKRGTVNSIIRTPGAGGFVATSTPLERFRRFCQFDATTGCVLWTGGTTNGRGNSAVYGAFWYDGRRWSAHKWAAIHIHGLEVPEGHQVDHCCAPERAGSAELLLPNPLCVQHVQVLTGFDNNSLRHQRQLWILTQKGYHQAPPLFDEMQAPASIAVPFYDPPAWLDAVVKSAHGDCPF